MPSRKKKSGMKTKIQGKYRRREPIKFGGRRPPGGKRKPLFNEKSVRRRPNGNKGASLRRVDAGGGQWRCSLAASRRRFCRLENPKAPTGRRRRRRRRQSWRRRFRLHRLHAFPSTSDPPLAPIYRVFSDFYCPGFRKNQVGFHLVSLKLN